MRYLSLLLVVACAHAPTAHENTYVDYVDGRPPVSLATKTLLGASGVSLSTVTTNVPNFTVQSTTLSNGVTGTARGQMVFRDNPAQVGAAIWVDRELSATRTAICLAGSTSATCLNSISVDGTTTATFSSSVASPNFVAGTAGGSLGLSRAIAINTVPTVSSGFGTSPSVTTSNGTVAFTINIGTGGVATSGVIGLPLVTNGWVCNCMDLTTPSGATKTFMTAQTTSSCTVTNQTVSTGAAVAWAASAVLHCMAFPR